MYVVDVNVLVYAVHGGLPQHPASRAWLDRALAGRPQSVGLPWPSLLGFLRLVTSSAAFPGGAIPLADGWRQVERWLDAPAAWTPVPGPRHRWFLSELVADGRHGDVPAADLHLAALALENGLTVVSVDPVFGRLPGVRSVDPVPAAVPPAAGA